MKPLVVDVRTILRRHTGDTQSASRCGHWLGTDDVTDSQSRGLAGAAAARAVRRGHIGAAGLSAARARMTPGTALLSATLRANSAGAPSPFYCQRRGVQTPRRPRQRRAARVLLLQSYILRQRKNQELLLGVVHDVFLQIDVI